MPADLRTADCRQRGNTCPAAMTAIVPPTPSRRFSVENAKQRSLALPVLDPLRSTRIGSVFGTSKFRSSSHNEQNLGNLSFRSNNCAGLTDGGMLRSPSFKCNGGLERSPSFKCNGGLERSPSFRSKGGTEQSPSNGGTEQSLSNGGRPSASNEARSSVQANGRPEKSPSVRPKDSEASRTSPCNRRILRNSSVRSEERRSPKNLTITAAKLCLPPPAYDRTDHGSPTDVKSCRSVRSHASIRCVCVPPV